MLIRKKTMFLLALGFVILSGCQKEETIPEVSHVLLVYLTGDNNLSGETYQKMHAIVRGWDGNPSRRILIWHDPKDDTPAFYEVKRGSEGNQVQFIMQPEEVNSADATVFAEVLEQTRSLYPAAGYGLLFFSHASGWLPEGALENPTRSVGRDGTDEMELADLSTAIPDHFFDYIIFETCYMAGIEVAWSLRNKTDYILASSAEIVSPGFTEVYETSINEVLHGELFTFASRAFAYFENASGFYRSATLSLIHTPSLIELADWVKTYYIPEIKPDINTIQSFDRTSYKLFFDFEEYYGQYAETDGERVKLNELINRSVIWKAATPDFLLHYGGFEIRSHSGLTTYIPQEWFPGLNTAWYQTEWYRQLGK